MDKNINPLIVAKILYENYFKKEINVEIDNINLDLNNFLTLFLKDKSSIRFKIERWHADELRTVLYNYNFSVFLKDICDV